MAPPTPPDPARPPLSILQDHCRELSDLLTLPSGRSAHQWDGDFTRWYEQSAFAPLLAELYHTSKQRLSLTKRRRSQAPTVSPSTVPLSKRTRSNSAAHRLEGVMCSPPRGRSRDSNVSARPAVSFPTIALARRQTRNPRLPHRDTNDLQQSLGPDEMQVELDSGGASGDAASEPDSASVSHISTDSESSDGGRQSSDYESDHHHKVGPSSNTATSKTRTTKSNSSAPLHNATPAIPELNPSTHVHDHRGSFWVEQVVQTVPKSPGDHLSRALHALPDPIVQVALGRFLRFVQAAPSTSSACRPAATHDSTGIVDPIQRIGYACGYVQRGQTKEMESKWELAQAEQQLAVEVIRSGKSVSELWPLVRAECQHHLLHSWGIDQFKAACGRGCTMLVAWGLGSPVLVAVLFFVTDAFSITSHPAAALKELEAAKRTQGKEEGATTLGARSSKTRQGAKTDTSQPKKAYPWFWLAHASEILWATLLVARHQVKGIYVTWDESALWMPELAGQQPNHVPHELFVSYKLGRQRQWLSFKGLGHTDLNDLRMRLEATAAPLSTPLELRDLRAIRLLVEYGLNDADYEHLSAAERTKLCTLGAQLSLAEGDQGLNIAMPCRKSALVTTAMEVDGSAPVLTAWASSTPAKRAFHYRLPQTRTTQIRSLSLPWTEFCTQGKPHKTLKPIFHRLGKVALAAEHVPSQPTQEQIQKRGQECLAEIVATEIEQAVDIVDLESFVNHMQSGVGDPTKPWVHLTAGFLKGRIIKICANQHDDEADLVVHNLDLFDSPYRKAISNAVDLVSAVQEGAAPPCPTIAHLGLFGRYQTVPYTSKTSKDVGTIAQCLARTTAPLQEYMRQSLQAHNPKVTTKADFALSALHEDANTPCVMNTMMVPNLNTVSDAHIDPDSQAGCHIYIGGDFTGGATIIHPLRLIIGGGDGTIMHFKSAELCHATLPFEGRRFSLVYFTGREFDKKAEKLAHRRL